MFLPYFLPHSSYHWILIIFTNIFSLKLEFRAISDVHDAWNKMFQKISIAPFLFTVKRNYFSIK